MQDRSNKNTAIIVSAGRGTRMGGLKKNFLPLLDLPVLIHTLRPFELSPYVSAIIVVVGAQDIEYCREEIVERFSLKKVRAVVAGGTERQDSVRLGLAQLDDENESPDEVVIIHDGARCLVTRSIIEDTIRLAREGGAAVAMVRPKDTIKEVNPNNAREVQRTLNRVSLRCVQTPQAFRKALLKRAMDKAEKDGFVGTDTSSLVERLGEKVLIVEGSYENIKITTQEDLIFAQRILQQREKQ